MTPPSWLPPLASVEGPLDETIDRLYQVFTQDFKDAGCKYGNVPVQFSRRVLAGEQHEETFWHVVSKEKSRGTGIRNFDSCRARRLPWCKAIIEHTHEESVTVWKDYVNRKLRTFLWLEAHDYVVVLEEGTRRDGEIAILVTAYCVEGRSTRRRLRNSYRRRLL